MKITVVECTDRITKTKRTGVLVETQGVDRMLDTFMGIIAIHLLSKMEVVHLGLNHQTVVLGMIREVVREPFQEGV